MKTTQEKIDVIQITEEQARDMYELCVFDKEETILAWKENGFIKKKALEEARIFFGDLYHNDSLRDDAIYSKDDLYDLQYYYEEAIKEIQGK